MKLLLTSAGIKNPSILDALVDLLGKPIAEASALCIPTAAYGSSYSTPAGPWRFISGRSDQPMTELGWRSLGVLELTALPSVGSDRWVEWIRETDALLVNGGDALYLCHWMRESGLADLLPSLRDSVWVGFSAGSMVLTPRIGEDFVGWKVAQRQRRNAGRRRLLDLPAPGSPGSAGEHDGRGRTMGFRLDESGIRNRRRHRHKGGRRHRRRHLPGALEAVRPQPGNKRIRLGDESRSPRPVFGNDA